MKRTERTALVLGATGGIGGEVARQLVARGWMVRALTRRDSLHDRASEGIRWIKGDAMVRSDVAGAADGCAAIVHAVNPPGYRHWGEQVLPMLDHTIQAAKQSGATIVLPGTLYNFGPDVLPVVRPGAPQQPSTRKGAIRAQMEERLRAAASSGARAIVVRAGDFFGPRPGNSWFSQMVVKPWEPLRVVRSLSRDGIGHQWAYLPDVAATMVGLLEREDGLPAFSEFHTSGHWDHDGSTMIASILRVASRYGLHPAVKPFPWWALPFVAPFVPTVREALELKYLWEMPVRMPNDELVDMLGSEPHTPWDVAVETSLLALGCLPEESGVSHRRGR